MRRQILPLPAALLRATSLLAVLVVSTPAWVGAQSPDRPLAGEAPTLGVRLHDPAVAGTGDASALEVNPAGLGWLPSWSLRLHHAELRSKSRLPGTGTALFAAAPLPFFRKLSFAAGFQWLRPSEAIGYADTIKLSLGTAIRLRPWLSLGASFHTLISDGDSGIDGIGAMDAGLALRPLEWLGFGFTVRNLNTPLLRGLPLSRVYDLELALRPFATNRLELGLGFALDERRGDFDPHARLSVEPLVGLRIFSYLEVLRRDFYRDGDERTDVRFSVGLGFDFERIGFAVATLMGRHMNAGAGPLSEKPAREVFQGASIALSLHGQRRAPLVEGAPALVELTLGKRLSQRQLVGLIGLFRSIEKRKDLAGLLLRIDGFSAGWGQTQELRRWIRRLRRAGKRVYAYLRAPNARNYYLAAGATRVLLDPAGGLRLAGLASQRLYFRGLFDKIGAKPQFIRIAEYKSAPESYTRTGPSEASQRVTRSLVNDLYGQLVHDVARDRKVTAKQLRATIDQGPFTPPYALKAGLVDEVLGPERLRGRVQALAEARLVPASKVLRRTPRWPVGPQIAVIVIEGDIVHGKSTTIPLLGRRVVGDRTIAAALGWAQSNARVKGVVLRINSPGGSALASDRMWRAARELAKRKPLIVSMADVAASGGYYAAAAAHRIYAMPGTITGSIGIFSGKFDLGALLDKLGISVHTEARGKRATMESFTRSYSADEQKFLLSRLRYYYDSFVSAVAAGRKMTVKAVDAVARGRVWTGAQARREKLVDAHGGLTEAIAEVKRRAGLGSRPVRLVVLPHAPKGLLQLAKQLLGARARTADSPLLPAPVRELVETIPPVFWHARSGAPLTRLPLWILP